MWKDLTIEQKAEIFRTAVSAGLTSLDEIKKLYNRQSKMNTPDIDDPYPEGMGENYYSNGGHTDTVEDYYYPITPVPSDYTTSVENTILYPINNFLTYSGNLFKKGGEAKIPKWKRESVQDLWWNRGQRIYNMMVNEWGLTSAEAIGILANMGIESDVDYKAVSPPDKRGVIYRGLVQNIPGIVNYIKKYYGDYSEESQLQFLRDGLEGKMRGADKTAEGKDLQRKLQSYRKYIATLDPNDPKIYRRAAGAFNAHYENPQIGVNKGIYEVGEPRMYTGEQMGIRLGRTTQTTTPTVQPTVQQTPISDRKIVASPPTTTNKEENKAYSPKYKVKRKGEWEYSGPNISYIDPDLPPWAAMLIAGVPLNQGTSTWGIRSKNANYGVPNSHHKVAWKKGINVDNVWYKYRKEIEDNAPEEEKEAIKKYFNSIEKSIVGRTYGSALDITPAHGYNYDDLFKAFANPALQEWAVANNYGLLDERPAEVRARTHATGPHLHYGPDSKIPRFANNKLMSYYTPYWEDRAALMNTSLPVQETPSIENVDYSDIYTENADTPTVYENEVERRTGTQDKVGFSSGEGTERNPIALDEVVVTPPKILPSEEDDARMLLDDYYFGNNIEMPLRNGSVIPDLIMPNYVSHIPQTPMLEVNMPTPYTDLILGRGRNVAKKGGRLNIFDDRGLTNLYTLGEDKYKNGGRLFGIGGYSNPNTNEFWASKGWRWEDVTKGKARPGVEYTNLPTSGKVLVDSEGYYVPKRIADEYQKMNHRVQEAPAKLTNTLPTDAIAAPPRITPSIPKMPKNELITKGRGYLRNYYFHNGTIMDENGNEISPSSEGNAGADFHQLITPDVPFEGPVLDTITVSAQANPNKPLDKAYTVFPWEDLTSLEKAEAQRDGINVHYTTSPEVEKDAYDFQYSTSPSAHEMELKKADDFVRNFSMTQPNAKEMNNLLSLAEIIAMGAGGAYGMWAAPIATLAAAGAGMFGSGSLNSLINHETKGAYKTWGDWASDKLTSGLITPENMEITNPAGLIYSGVGFKAAPPLVRGGAEFVNYAIPNRATRVLWDLSNDYGATPLWDIIKDNNKLNNITYILDKNGKGTATSAVKNRNLEQINEVRQFVADANIALKTSMLPKGLDTFYNNTPSKFMGRREQFTSNINGGIARYNPSESKVYLPFWRNSASNVPLDYSYNWQPYQRAFVSASTYAPNRIYEHMSGRWLAGHELEHAAQELANYDITSLPDPSINKSYFYANPNHPLYNKGLNILDNSKTPWKGSPSEVDSEIMGFRTLYNQPEYTHMSPSMQKKLCHFISKRFDVTEEEANTLIKLLTENRLTAPGR